MQSLNYMISFTLYRNFFNKNTFIKYLQYLVKIYRKKMLKNEIALITKLYIHCIYFLFILIGIKKVFKAKAYII